MKWKLQGPALLLKTVRQNFFLRQHFPESSTLQLLQTLYPKIKWDRVRFYEGLPWFTPIVAPYVNAQALPDFYSLGRFKIYLRKYDESRAQCIADIVHEAFHVMQAMQFGKGYGFGVFRGWIVYYIAHFIHEGYRGNVFEIPAYDQEFRFLKFCERRGLHGIMPKLTEPQLLDIAKEKELIFTRFDFRYRLGIHYLIASVFIGAATAVLKPVVDCLLFIVTWPVEKNNT